MSRCVDPTRQKFKRLVVITKSGKDKNNHVLWLCLCDCGQRVIVQSSHLLTGHTQSCGCLKGEGNNTRHNHIITYNNKTQCLIEWAEKYRINYQLLWKRIYRYKWSPEKALTTPAKKRRKS